MAFLTLPDGVPMYYEDHGEGSPVVLIHGWTMNGTFWGQNVPALSGAHRVINVDLRGHGQSGKTDSGHTIAQYAADVHHLIRHLDLGETSLVGWSMGTAVILSYAEQFGTDLVSSTTLVDQSPRFLNGPDWDFPLFGAYTPADIGELVQGLHHARPLVVKPFIADCFASTPPAEVVDAVYAETTKMSTSAAADVWFDMAYADFRPVLPHLDVPTLLAYGQQSKIFPGDLDKWLSTRLPDAHLAPFAQSGHAPFSEEPDLFNKTLLDFLG